MSTTQQTLDSWLASSRKPLKVNASMASPSSPHRGSTADHGATAAFAESINREDLRLKHNVIVISDGEDDDTPSSDTYVRQPAIPSRKPGRVTSSMASTSSPHRGSTADRGAAQVLPVAINRKYLHTTHDVIVISDDEDDDTPSSHACANRLTIQRNENKPPLPSYSKTIVIIDDDDESSPTLSAQMARLSSLVEWPHAIKRIKSNINPGNVTFDDINVGTCSCTFVCQDHCLNFASGVYCHGSNCKVGKTCGNRLLDLPSLSIIWCSKGYGVVATRPIPQNTIIGEYRGTIVLASDLTRQQIQSGYVLQFQSRSTGGETVYVDASQCGSICRLVNHSCAPNCRFEERSNRTSRRMVIISHQSINPGNEVTVKYTDQITFRCICMSDNCVSKMHSQA